MEKIVKYLVFILYPLIAVCMATATIVEKYQGTAYVAEHIYGAWWFSMLWALLALCAVAWMVHRRMHQWALVLLHGGMAVVLAGALVTHLTCWQGKVHLRAGAAVSEVQLTEGRGQGTTRPLPFTIRLNRFQIQHHEGSDDVSDYISHLTLTNAQGSTTCAVMMNRTVSQQGVTLMQSGYDSDGMGSILILTSDPIGTPITYTGYGLLFAGVIAMLLYRRSTFRRLLASPLLRQTTFGAVLLAGISMPIQAQGDSGMPPTLPRQQAKELGTLLVLHNGRVCPLQTYALDFTRKLYGSSSYRGLTAEQVVTGWLFWPDRWADEPFVKTGRQLQSTLQFPAHASFNQYFNRDMGGYILGPYLNEYYRGAHDKFHDDVMAVDDRLQLIVDLRRGATFKVFPLPVNGGIRWYAPTDNIPARTPRGHTLFIHTALELLRTDAVDAQYAQFSALVAKLSVLQQRYGGTSLPTPTQVKAERLYNALPVNTVLFMLNLTVGFVLLLSSLARMGRTKAPRTVTIALTGGLHNNGPSLLHRILCHGLRRCLHRVPLVLMVLSFLMLTLFGILRWTVSGTVPMSNGFETMLFVAWLVMAVSLLCAHRLPVILTFGFIMSGFFLLVSHLSQMDPQISHVMPVLNSPLLSIHVSIIMFAFALLSITFICAVTALLASLRLSLTCARNRSGYEDRGRLLESYTVLSRLFLYPAITMLTIGIFVGAIWAERSWGTYWGWDPKEVWALITLMIYAIPLHTSMLKGLRRPMAYHLFMALAFLSIVMTYFGVNYFLGGMHSYA